MDATFRRNGIYRSRYQIWFPWSITDWWQPRIYRGGDEWCNDSVVFIVPPLGGLVIFWRPGSLRRMPCDECWAEHDEISRADYALCGYLHGGRLNPGAHHHADTGVCERARRWLVHYERIRVHGSPWHQVPGHGNRKQENA